MIRALPVLLASTALAFAACGDSGDSGGSGGGGGGSSADTRPPKDVFTGSCGSCHTLAAAGTQGQTGPNLDDLKPDKDTVLTAIAEGPSIMPAGLLEGAAADRVAQYVADNAGK